MFGAPMFEPEVFRKQTYCFGRSAYDIVVTSGPLQWFDIRGIVSLSPLVTPLVLCIKNRKIFRK